jgi:hypothetical protein
VNNVMPCRREQEMGSEDEEKWSATVRREQEMGSEGEEKWSGGSEA